MELPVDFRKANTKLSVHLFFFKIKQNLSFCLQEEEFLRIFDIYPFASTFCTEGFFLVVPGSVDNAPVRYTCSTGFEKDYGCDIFNYFPLPIQTICKHPACNCHKL